MTSSDHKQTNLAVRYRFVPGEFDCEGLPDAFPVRDTWEEAAADACEAGKAEWVRNSELRLVSGKIERVR